MRLASENIGLPVPQKRRKHMFANLETGNSTGYYIHSLICVVLMFGLGHLPAPSPITPTGMHVVGIFIGMIYGWLTVGMTWPSILGITALGFSGRMTVVQAFQSGFGNNTILLIFFMFIITGVLDTSGVARYVANRLVSFRFSRGRPWVLSFLILFSMFVLSSMISITAAIMVVWTMFYGICEVFGFKKGDKWPMLMLAGIAFSGSMAYQLFPFKSLPLIVLDSYQELSGGQEINFFKYFIWMFVTDWLVILGYLLVMRFIFKPDVSLIEQADTSLDNTEKLTPYQGFILVYFGIYVLLMLIPSILPGSWSITGVLRAVNNTGISAFAVIFLVFLNFRDGTPINDMVKKVNWNLIFLLVGALTISSALADPQLGVRAFISEVMTPVLSGQSFWIFAFLLLLAACIITNFCNNLATVAIFTLIAYNLAEVYGGDVNIKALMVVLITICSMAMATPAGSTPGALVYGNKEWIPGNYPLILGIICVVIDFVVIYAIGLPFANMLF